MKKTLVKGLVALAAGALLAGGLLGCQQTVDSITVKPSSLDSANVKAVHTPGFFALTWDRVKNCAGYAIEMEDVSTGQLADITESVIQLHGLGHKEDINDDGVPEFVYAEDIPVDNIAIQFVDFSEGLSGNESVK